MKFIIAFIAIGAFVAGSEARKIDIMDGDKETKRMASIDVPDMDMTVADFKVLLSPKIKVPVDQFRLMDKISRFSDSDTMRECLDGYMEKLDRIFVEILNRKLRLTVYDGDNEKKKLCKIDVAGNTLVSDVKTMIGQKLKLEPGSFQIRDRIMNLSDSDTIKSCKVDEVWVEK